MNSFQLFLAVFDLVIFAIFLSLFAYINYLFFMDVYKDHKRNKQDKIDNDLYERSAE